MAALPRHLFASVATFDPPPVDRAIPLLSDAFAALVAPLLASPQPDPGVTRAIRFCRDRSDKVQVAPLDHAGWGRVKKAGPLRYLMVSAWRESNLLAGQSSTLATVLLHYADNKEGAPLRASVFDLSISEPVLGGSVPRAVQQGVTGWTRQIFTGCAGVTGYVTLDHVSAQAYGSMSPYESRVGLSFPWAAPYLRDKVRGYYWGNLLGARQVELLGGLPALRQAFSHPSVLIEELPGGAAYVQLTDDINRIDRTLLGQLREVVRPLLPEGYPQAPDYYQSLPAFLLVEEP